MSLLETPQKVKEECFENKLSLQLSIGQYQLSQMNHSKPTESSSRSGQLLSTVPIPSPGQLLTSQAKTEENNQVPTGHLFALRLLMLN